MVFESTVWYSYAQFCDVFNRLSDKNEYGSLLFNIELWMLRGHVPAAVQGTYSLLNAILCDDDEFLPSHSKSCIYSMSIIRAVNLLLDQEQNSLYAKNMLLMAKKANLPESVIRCRHKSSHSEIPDIDTLRIVAKEAINYLYKKYWMSQFDAITSKVKDKDSDVQWLFAIYILCCLTISSQNGDVKRPLHGELNVILNRYVARRVNCKVDHVKLKDFFSDTARIISICTKKGHLSLRRKLMAKRGKHGHERILVELVYLVSKKVLNGCLHEDVFLSIFVEFIFVNYQPIRSHLFFVVLFYTITKLSFNFTIKLVTQMLSIVCGLSDLKSLRNANTQERIESYFRAFRGCNPTEYLKELHIGTNIIKKRVNRWLVILLEYGKCVTGRQPYRYHSKYVEITRLLSNKEYNRMLSSEFTGLTKILRATQLLVPYAVLKISKKTHETSDRLTNWEEDKISHIMNIMNSYGTAGRKCAFMTYDHSIKEKTALDIKNEIEEMDLNINKMLLPGTIWKNSEWKIAQTYPLCGADEVDIHNRITIAAKCIKSGNVTSCRDNGNLWKTLSRMYHINKNLECAQDERHKIASELNSVISYITNPDK